jgi:predicted permease
MRNFRLAFRALLQSPIVSAVAILSLAFGIGANTAIFALFEQILLRNLPVANPTELVNITANGPRSGSNSTNNAGGNDSIFSYPMFRDLEKVQTVFTGIAAHRIFGANLAYRGNTSSAEGSFVSGSYFPVLGLQPALGRLLTPADDESPGAHRLVVLSHAYWTERFNQNPQLLNEALLVNGVPMTIIGVAPRDFRSATLGSSPSIFVPLSMREALTPGWKGLTDRRNYWIYLFGRLKPGVSIEQAQATINGSFRAIIKDVDLPLQKGASDRYRERFLSQTMNLEPGAQGQSNMMQEARTPLILLLTITGFVLLIACANIANLLLARSANRAKEFAIRLSLGASRSQVIAQLMAEALLLAVLAGVAALFVAYGTSQFILSVMPPDASTVLISPLRPTIIAFTFGVSLVAGFLFGLFPAIHSTRPDLASAMKDQGGSVSASRSATRFRSALVTAQIALSLLLLVSAGLFLKSLVQIMRVDLGLKTANIVTFGLSPELNQYTPARSRALFERIEEAVAALPGITAVTTSTVPLLAGNNWGSNVSIDGFEAGPDTDTHAMFSRIGSGFFRSFGIGLAAGREFAPTDSMDAPKVAIVNEAFVRKFSPSSSALGKRMQMGAGGKNDIEIVGIVKDAKYSQVKDATPPLFYLPYRQDPGIGATTFYVKTTLPTEQTVPALRQAIAALDSNLPIEQLKTLEAQVNENIVLDRLVSTLAAAFAALATVLAAVGLYGVLAFTVARRTREIGIRLAIGASTSAIRNMVLREVGVMVAVGVAVGLPAAWLLGRYAETLLYEIKSGDPAVLAGAILLVALVSFGSGYLPARRAMSTDPMQALRYE